MSRDGEWRFQTSDRVPKSCILPLELRLLRELLGDGLEEEADDVFTAGGEHPSSCITIYEDEVDDFLLELAAYPEDDLREIIVLALPDYLQPGATQQSKYAGDLNIWFDDGYDVVLDVVRAIVKRHPQLSPFAFEGAYAGYDSYGWVDIVTPDEINKYDTSSHVHRLVEEIKDRQALAAMGGVWVEA